jgi:hypothetical protein
MEVGENDDGRRKIFYRQDGHCNWGQFRNRVGHGGYPGPGRCAVVIQARRQDRLDQAASEITAQGDKTLALAGDAGVQADGIHWLLRLLPHVNVNKGTIRPTGHIFP